MGSPSRKISGKKPRFTDPVHFNFNYDQHAHYIAHECTHPSSVSAVAVITAGLALLFLLFLLLTRLDDKLHIGLRYVPWLALLLVLGHIVKDLWFLSLWGTYKSSRRGLDLVERQGFKIHRREQEDDLKKNLRIRFEGPPRVIVALSGNGGGGHEATQRGLRQLLEEIEFPCVFYDCPLAWMIDTNFANPMRNIFGITGEQLYNWGLRQGAFVAWFTSNFCHWGQFFGLNIDVYCAGLVGNLLGVDYGDVCGRMCARIWDYYEPDLILDFTQGTGNVVYSGLRRAGKLHIPVVKVVSDFEGRGAHRWIEDVRQYILCGTSKCRTEALDYGVPSHQVVQTSGMILRPGFYEADSQHSKASAGASRSERIQRMGLDPTVRTALVCWGGVGSSKVKDVGERIAKSRTRVNIIFLCGRNQDLLHSIKRHDWGDVRVLVMGFTQEVSMYMQLSDFLVCKPGPGICSEASVLHLPMIVEWSTFTLPQEVPVSRWVIERGLGLGFQSIHHITARVEQMCRLLGPDMTKVYGPNPFVGEGLEGIDRHPQANRALFEVPGILEHVLSTHDYTPKGPAKGAAPPKGAAAAGAWPGSNLGGKDEGKATPVKGRRRGSASKGRSSASKGRSASPARGKSPVRRGRSRE